MDAADATPAPFGAWAWIRGYFTPATLFLVLNLVIGTIALTSRSHQQRRRRREHHDDYAHHQGQYQYHQEPLDDPHQQQQQEYHHYYQQPLARTSSVLDRLRSIGLYRFRSGDFPPEYGAAGAASHDVFAPVEEEATTHYARSRSEPAAPARAEEEEKRAPLRTTKKSGAMSLRPQEPSSPPRAEYHQFQEAEYVPPPAPMRAPPPLSRTSSVLDRLRSLGLYSFLSAAEQPVAATATPVTDATAGDSNTKHAHHAHYDRSRSEPAPEQGKKEKKEQAADQARMGKSSSSAARKPHAAASRLLVEEDCVDARAEAFIDSFRKEQSQKQAVVLHGHDEDEHVVVVPPPPAPLARTSSVLDRLRSFSLYLRSGADDPVPSEDAVNKASAADEKQQQYGRSRSEPAREQLGKKKKKTTQQGADQARMMSKTTSLAAAPRNVAEEAAPPAEECVDARADDFINKFRQQLHLQRLNSLLNYKELLNRGGGGGNQ